MPSWRTACWMVLLLALTGCAATPPTPHALNLAGLHLPRKVFVTQVQTPSAPMPRVMPVWQIVVQQEGEALRWLRFDLLGVPDARQILENGRWRNDGFIPANAAARDMFAALLFAWMQDANLDAAYGAARWTVMWPNRAEKDIFSIVRRQDGARWDVRPVPEVP